MITFEEVWKDLGYHYGEDELEDVKLGWELAQKEYERQKEDFEVKKLPNGDFEVVKPKPMEPLFWNPEEIAEASALIREELTPDQLAYFDHIIKVQQAMEDEWNKFCKDLIN